ncbi:MAG: site-specific DNA-methyltransferase [Spirochaetaceae bacterium]|nr:site-specific DNA-methyltransferase [Spirochaetaceae bacterium]
METTRHQVHFADARRMSAVPDGSVSLVVTSPPYPMIELWDEQFAAADPLVAQALAAEDGDRAFESMHARLDAVWRECYRVLQPGGLVCINIGDATRKIDGEFRLFSNHSRILQALNELKFSILPDILWRKPTNAPNKFLGSGMLPAGAYVTYEHEYVLIARKGGPRRFSPADKVRRRRSAFFWEERNKWFSDVWLGLVGAKQLLGDAGSDDRDIRARSAAFPFELAFRLIQMYSLIGDTVLDPFLGTGTTTAAAIAGGRSSIGFEIERSLEQPIRNTIETAVPLGREYAHRRLEAHLDFVHAREEAGRACRHLNRHYGFPVVTGQETDLQFTVPTAVESVTGRTFSVEHEPAPLPVRSSQIELPFASNS